ncbi:hypothetical protein AA0243_0504 [Novacetimonas hansenii NRIC 0243]|nr:hypothetical protein AA0243_0504 [Novacetimonas hansenii NRIC 0243]
MHIFAGCHGRCDFLCILWWRDSARIISIGDDKDGNTDLLRVSAENCFAAATHDGNGFSKHNTSDATGAGMGSAIHGRD